MQTLNIILRHIPGYVWAILAFIIVMGFKQSRDQLMGRARLMILPLVWLLFGAWGVESSFGLNVAPLLAWALGLIASVMLVKRSGWPGSSRHDTDSGTFFVPGSWLPFGLMMAIFCGKFALGMSLAFHPEMARDVAFGSGFSALFGVLGGVFLGRSRNILGRSPSLLTPAEA
jgi:hypothetical protein